jgi:transcriptional regulator with PAS, ATPase and Fis domain
MIPENSIIINKPVSFYQKFKIQIITLISIIIFLTILCMYLSNYITKMHNLENELQKNKEQLKKTIDNIHDFVITTDESGKILQTNRMLLDKFSLNKNNILGLNIKTFLSEYDIFNNSQKTDSNIVNSDNTSLKTNFKGYIYDQNKDNDNTNNDNTNYNNKNDVFSYTEELIGLNKIEKSKFDECFSKKSSIILNNFKFGNIVLKGICSPIKLEKMNSTIFVFTLKDRTEEFKREVIIKNQNIILHSMFEKTPYLISI